MNTSRKTNRLCGVLLASFLAGSTGCFQSLPFMPLPKPPSPSDATSESFILRTGGLVPDQDVVMSPELRAELEIAREAYRKEDYAKAERLFNTIAERDKTAPQAVQEAIYYRGECLRLTGQYPKACDVYASLVAKFPNTQYREQCVERMYDIANFWLEDTWKEMKEDKERREGKRWVVWPRWFSTEKTKPFFDREGRAVEALEKVRLHDITGPLADQALYRCGIVKMYNEDYREAEQYFSQVHVRHPDSKLAPKSIELAVFCKQMSTGGSSYDGRKTAEARQLIQTALRAYPELANDPQKREYLEGQRKAIDLQQAEKEYKMAEFYRRTGQYGSAYFYYELVRRRYPQTKYAKLSEERWADLRAWLERNGEAVPGAK